MEAMEVKYSLRGGCLAEQIAFLLPIQCPRAQLLPLPRIFLLTLLRFIDSTTQNSGKRLDNVNLTHLVLASV